MKLIAVVVGVIATGVPIILLNGWLKRQGEDEVSVSAAWAMQTAESQLALSITALRDLSAKGVDSCKPQHLDAMRQTAIVTGPIKQVMLLGPDGDVLCTDSGVAGTKFEILTPAATDKSGGLLEVVRGLGRDDRLMRIRAARPAAKGGLAALVPVSQLLPQASIWGGSPRGAVRLTMADGALAGELGTAPDRSAGAAFSDTVTSQRYPIAVSVTMARKSVVASYDDLRRISIVITGGLALIILSFALLLMRRQPASDPSADMAKAILEDEFVPYYQPVVDLQNGKLLGAEVLVRWKRPDGTIVEPNAFILLLESSGLVLEFTRKLMRRVRNELGDAVGARPAMTLAFNIAPRHFEDALILNDLGNIFDGSAIRLSQIVLELTERHEVADFTKMRRTVAALQRVGCKVAIDDVGTGHSGLSYILKLGVDIIKIDKIFVEAIGPENHSKAIIETLIDLAKNMRMEIVAEGVETFDQVTYLRERGIGAAQGYVFAPPLPASSFLKLLDAMDPAAASDGSAVLPAGKGKGAAKSANKSATKPHAKIAKTAAR